MIREFFLKEWLLILSAFGLIAVSCYIERLPAYSTHELLVLYFLFLLFVAVKGLDHSGLLRRISKYAEKGRAAPVKLVALTFLLSMLLTNDVALIVIVPLTLMLNYKHLERLVILEALAANAGSALTPFGNPQNLFIYWFYQIPLMTFLQVIAPLALASFALLLLLTLTVKHTPDDEQAQAIATTPISRAVYFYLACLLLIIMSTLNILPWWTGLLMIPYVLACDRDNFRVDYSMLLSFLFLFGMADNLDTLIQKHLENPRLVFVYSAIASQVMSNVPTSVLFSKLTGQWQDLLWGVNVGGFGSLIGSFANVIAYRQYAKHIPTNEIAGFTVRFLVFGYAFFMFGFFLYYLWR